jgi:hypothetical protein
MKKRKKIQESDYKKALENGISRNRVYARVNYQNWSIKEAVTKRVRSMKRPPDTYVMPSSVEHTPDKDINPASYHVAWQRGIGAERLEHRIRELNWTPWEAATTPIGEVPKRPKPVV